MINAKSTPTDQLIKLLAIIGFDGNKQEFTEQFLEATSKLAYAQLVDQVETSVNNSLFSSLDSNSKPEDLHRALTAYLGEEKVNEHIQFVLIQELSTYLKAISDSLTEQKKSEVTQFFGSLVQNG